MVVNAVAALVPGRSRRRDDSPPGPSEHPLGEALHEALRRFTGAPPQAGVRTIETHISWVFIVEDQVFKLKKPVRYPFLDFSTLTAREAACREELRLNRRLAPAVYRGVLALQLRDGRLSLAEDGAADARAGTLDWLVWMHRLPEARMLDRLLAGHAVRPREIDALADRLVDFFARARPAGIEADSLIARFEHEWAANAEVLLRPQFRLAGAECALDCVASALHRHRSTLRARVAAGRIVDGHGDLRPEHVCLLEPPVVIDALEFNARLRQVDPFEELAFLALECTMAGERALGQQLLARCARGLHDPMPPSLLNLYTADRALLRARLAMAHLLDPRPRTPQRWAPLAQRYVEHALEAMV